MVATRLRFFLLCLAVPIALATVYAVALEFTKHRFHEFPGVAGPPGVTVVARKAPTSWQRYGEGSTGRLAVLLTQSDSSWLGLAHALKSFGVPFRITTSVAEALKHKVVLVYPIVSGKVLSQDELKALASFPRQGGHLIGVKVLGGGMNEVFGFTDTLSSRRRFDIHLDPTSSPVLADFTEERERTIQLGDPDRFAEIVGTFGYSEPRKALAVYGDGSAAIIERAYAEGRAYAFGFDIGDYFFRGHHARHHRAHRSYVNAFEPAGDVLARLIKKIYLRGNPDAATLGTVPEGRDLSVVFSYDVDAEESYEIMLLNNDIDMEINLGVMRPYYLQNFRDLQFKHSATPIKYEALVNDPYYRNIVDYRLFVIQSNRIRNYTEITEKISKVVAMLDDELS